MNVSSPCRLPRSSVRPRRLTAACLALAAACTSLAPAHGDVIAYQMVNVGNPGNAADYTGNGSVGYSYSIGKYEVTMDQYAAFLNAVAKTDTYGLWSYSISGTDQYGFSSEGGVGINRAGTSGNYAYTALTVSNTIGGTPVSIGPNLPITSINWFSAARFANWMANGQPTGAQDATTTEQGAYALNGAVSGNAVGRSTVNPNTSAAPTFVIPTLDEWYKAAYYSPTKNGTGGYFSYATQSDTYPSNTPSWSGSNKANVFAGNPTPVYTTTQSPTQALGGQVYRTNVGTFSGSPSYYGTFDQSGNVLEWNDSNGLAGTTRQTLGGSWVDAPGGDAGSSNTYSSAPSSKHFSLGFRLASAPAWSSVPEIDPAGFGSVAALLTGAFGLLERRRRRLR